MTREEKNRLTKILQYNLGFLHALVWIETHEPGQIQFEEMYEKISDKINDLKTKLKKHDI